MKKKKLSNKDVDFMLFECEMHRLLDLLGAPEGRFVCKRLKDYLEDIGIDTDWSAEKFRTRCSNCGKIHRKGCMCPFCFRNDR